MLSSMPERNYKLFFTLIQHDQYFASTLYSKITADNEECCELFINTKKEFVKWITSCGPNSGEFSYLDTYLIGYLSKNPDFGDVYTDDASEYEHLIRFLISAWRRPVKGLKTEASMCRLIYLRYIRFLASEKGQDFLYGNSLDLYPEIEQGIPFEDRPFYEQEIFREEQLIKFKKHVIKKCCKTPLQCIEMRALWEATFDGGSFSYKKAANIVRKHASETSVGNTALYYHLKRLHVEMLQEILADGNLDTYFGGDIPYEINGKTEMFSELIRRYIIDAVLQFEKAKKERIWTDVKIADSVAKFFTDRGIRISRINASDSVLVKVKSDRFINTKKGWNLYFLKGGGYIDFSTGSKGFVTDIVPKAYFK